ncbi:hypothetical protein [Mesorhizobium sp. CN2-181]|uniref:hypothetical protein n=1 Tax=Mesorhizobium yinganensis TaxID=3157707 RepID=UPI0032B7FBE7
MKYQRWLDGHRQTAIARGGRALRYIPKGYDEGFLDSALMATRDRKPGEIVNPQTGELMSPCLTVGRFATELGTTTRGLYVKLEALGVVHRVLSWKDVPTITAPATTKPEYFHRHTLTPWALAEGHGVVIKARDGQPMELLTPRGQAFIREGLSGPRVSDATLRDRIGHLADTAPWLSHRDIARKLGCNQTTVSRHMKRLAA